jgi:hypothetical protein
MGAPLAGRGRTWPLKDTQIKALGLGNAHGALRRLVDGRKVSLMIYRSEPDIALRPGPYVRIELRIDK